MAFTAFLLSFDARTHPQPFCCLSMAFCSWKYKETLHAYEPALLSDSISTVSGMTAEAQQWSVVCGEGSRREHLATRLPDCCSLPADVAGHGFWRTLARKPLVSILLQRGPSGAENQRSEWFCMVQGKGCVCAMCLHMQTKADIFHLFTVKCCLKLPCLSVWLSSVQCVWVCWSICG